MNDFERFLPAEEVADVCVEFGYTFRERIDTPVITVWMFLGQTLSSHFPRRDAGRASTGSPLPRSSRSWQHGWFCAVMCSAIMKDIFAERRLDRGRGAGGGLMKMDGFWQSRGFWN